MLNADDQNTFLAIRELTKLMEESQKPLIFWIGAGASKWLDYPLWNELALDLRRQFFKYVPGFDNDLALRLIRENSFPQFFQQCRSLDQPRYFKLLSDAFLPRSETAIYKRFVSYLTALAPLHILTTNVDEALEQRITNTAIFQRSDLSGCIPQLQAGMPFIATYLLSIFGTICSPPTETPMPNLPKLWRRKAFVHLPEVRRDYTTSPTAAAWRCVPLIP